MEWLGLPSEFWSAVIGAIVGGVVGAGAAGWVTLMTDRRRSRLDDLMRLQELVESFAQWVVGMSVSPAKTVDVVDELDQEGAGIAFRGKTLLSRINDPEITDLSKMVFEKSVQVIAARAHGDEQALFDWRDKITKSCGVLTDMLSSHIRGRGVQWRFARSWQHAVSGSDQHPTHPNQAEP